MTRSRLRKIRAGVRPDARLERGRRVHPLLLCGAQAVYHGIYRPRLVGMKFAQKF